MKPVLNGVSAQAPTLPIAPPASEDIGRGLPRIAEISAKDREVIRARLGLVESPASLSATVAEQNTALAGPLEPAFKAPDADAASLARFALDSLTTVMHQHAVAEAKAEDRPPPAQGRTLLRLAARIFEAHVEIARGTHPSLEKKSKSEVQEKQRLSRAILSTLAEQLWQHVGIEDVLRRAPALVAELYRAPTPKQRAALEARLERAFAAASVRRLFDTIAEAQEAGLKLPMGERVAFKHAVSNVDADPAAAKKAIAALHKTASAFLADPPPAPQKKGAKPPPDPKELMAKGRARLKELEAEVADAPAPSMQERFRGAMIGLAIGDALGGPTEFMSIEEIRAKHGLVTDMVGGGWLRLKKGEYTDDTQMAERMADSIVAQGGFVIEDVAKGFVAWLNTEPKDVGGLTREALMLARAGLPPEQAGLIPWMLSGFDNAGNGSVMRAAPVALLTAFRPVAEIDATARASSAITHADPRATYGAAAISYAVSLILAGESDVTGKVAAWLLDKSPELASAIAQVKDMKLSEVRTSGFSVHTVQAAFWALEHADSYPDGIVKVTNRGEDTDTAGATAGILLGAKFGLQGIPATWREKLQNRNKLEGLADKIYALAVA